jgi:DegV family protein with EDD domain
VESIAIVTDTGADLAPGIKDLLGIRVVPLRIRFGETELIDGVDISAAEFWKRCSTQKELPSTAAPSIGDFKSVFEEALSDGHDGVLCVTISSKLSATYQAAAAAAADLAGTAAVEVVDSLNVTVAQGLLTSFAAETAQDCSDLKELRSTVEAARTRTKMFGTIDNLDFLHRGGRIGTAAALVGSVLSFKPVIEVREGIVELESRQRTRSRALRYMLELVSRLGTPEALAVAHAMASDVDEVLSGLHAAFPNLEPSVSILGPTIGTHTGPGTIGIGLRLPV